MALVAIGYDLGLSGFASRDFDVPSPLTTVQLLLDGYAGALLSWALARWKVRTTAVWG